MMIFPWLLVMIGFASMSNVRCEPIYFVSDRGGSSAIYYMDERGSIATIFVLPEEMRDQSISGLRASPDRRHIAFSISDGKLCTIASDGASFKILGHGYLPSWSPDGKQIVFQNEGKIYIVNVKTLEVKNLADNGWSPDGSPDGEWIAFIRDKESIILIKPDGKNAHTIFEAKSNSISRLVRLAWSPDAEEIALIPGGRMAICIVGSDGKDFAFIYPNPDGQIHEMVGVDCPSWSHDGRRIIFVRTKAINNPDWDVWIMNRDGTDKEKVIDSPANEEYPVFASSSYHIQPLKTMEEATWGMIKR